MNEQEIKNIKMALEIIYSSHRSADFITKEESAWLREWLKSESLSEPKYRRDKSAASIAAT